MAAGDLDQPADEHDRHRAATGHGARSHPAPAGLYRTGAGRALAIAVGLLFVLTIGGLVALWPGEPRSELSLGEPSLAATVVASDTVACGPVDQPCRRLRVRVDEGPDSGRIRTITLGPVELTADPAAGAKVRVTRNTGAPPEGATGLAAERYSFSDFDRRSSLLWLAIAFAILAVALTRWRGALAIVGVALSMLLITAFLIPALLSGSSPLLVSLVGALAVMFVTLGLTNGVGAQSLAAALGIAVSLLLATGLGYLVLELAHLDGRSSEFAPILNQASDGGLSLQGVLLAGMVVGALGVLADMGVSQASAVMALRRANPAYGMRELYAGAFAVGRDHLSATIHTLVLAYVGATLPLLLIVQSASVGLGEAVNTTELAEPVVATLIGCIGLVAAVPLTTGLAALLVSRVPAATLPEHGHVH
ncbi:MAG: YibE/F family protein [Solirubrobacteraceae bacterium]|nr:YibE/F family protein [Solirubrobacteraceae bacterium]